jgi:uncharacterized protein YndB with AHSA1/START domain
MAEPTYAVHVAREFDAPIERVWAAWTQPDDLKAWWGPAGFTCPRAEADVRVGGRIFVTMRAPDGQDLSLAVPLAGFAPGYDAIR